MVFAVVPRELVSTTTVDLVRVVACLRLSWEEDWLLVAHHRSVLFLVGETNSDWVTHVAKELALAACGLDRADVRDLAAVCCIRAWDLASASIRVRGRALIHAHTHRHSWGAQHSC